MNRSTGRTGRGRRNYDECPQVDHMCTKNFPTVSFVGYGYPFLSLSHTWALLWVPSYIWEEGRKDPFSVMFKYMETPAEELFFNFACGLSKHCLNRESEFFKNTDFWHDIFHFINHTCGINFKSGRVLGLEGINSEICEEVNLYLQCVKYTSSHLSQEHFMFFIQFFLYLLNKDKTEIFKKQENVAVAGFL